jgi:putative ABC transport system permease protein
VTALMVSQRTREIGIRMALGAQSNEMLRMVLTQGMSVIGFGLAVGIMVALIFSRVMTALLFQTTVYDPVYLYWRCANVSGRRAGSQLRARASRDEGGSADRVTE